MLIGSRQMMVIMLNVLADMRMGYVCAEKLVGVCKQVDGCIQLEAVAVSHAFYIATMCRILCMDL